jgi:amino acid permease
MTRLFNFALIAALQLAAVSALAVPRSTSSSMAKPAAFRSKPLYQAVAVSGDDEFRGGAAGESGTGTATIPNEVFNLVKSIVGAGVLSLPYGVAYFGNAPGALFPAVSLIAVMGALSAYTFGLIGRVCQRTGTESYAAAWDESVGKKTSWLIAFSCFIDCFAGNLSYSMILSDTLVNLLASVGVAVTRTQALLGVTATVLTPLCLLKNLSSLAPFSLVGIIGMIYTTIAMGLRWYQGSYLPGGAFFTSQLAAPVFGAAGASAAMSPKALILTCMLSNAYIAHFNSPRFLSELKDNTMARFHQVIGWSFGVSVALYALITAAGFLTFGAASNGLVLNNYSTQDLLMSFSRVAVAVSITCSYPLIFVGTRDGLMDFFKVSAEKRTNQLLNKLTFGIMGLVTIIASQLTDLGLVASVGGATFGTALVFVYPTIMFLKSQKKRTAETIPAAVIGVLGVVMGVVGTALCFAGESAH